MCQRGERKAYLLKGIEFLHYKCIPEAITASTVKYMQLSCTMKHNMVLPVIYNYGSANDSAGLNCIAQKVIPCMGPCDSKMLILSAFLPVLL